MSQGGARGPDKLPRLLNVEAGRGLAATLVVAYHADRYYFDSDQYWSGSAFEGVFGFGNAGVEFFFVLSGLIIALLHWGELGVAGRVRPFMRKRFSRLYPFYWLCLAAAVAVFLAVPSFGEAKNREPWNVLCSVFLAGGDPHNAVIFVSWTLYHEVLFYAVVAVALWRPRLGLSLGLVWLTVCCAGGVMSWSVPYLVQSVNVLFALGVACALWLTNRRVPLPGLVTAGGGLLFLIVGLDQVYTNWVGGFLRVLSYGIATSLLLLGGVEIERSRRRCAPSVLVFLGKASYSVYLTHMLSAAVAAKIADHVGLTRIIPEPIAFLGLVSAGVLAGVVAHLWVEAPVIRFTRDQLRKLDAARDARASVESEIAVAPLNP